MLVKSVCAGFNSNGNFINVLPEYPNTNSNNRYSVGSTTYDLTIGSTPGSFCNSGAGTFIINSKTDSTSGSCEKMNLNVDSTSKIFTAHYPQPNL